MGTQISKLGRAVRKEMGQAALLAGECLTVCAMVCVGAYCTVSDRVRHATVNVLDSDAFCIESFAKLGATPGVRLSCLVSGSGPEPG